MIKSFRQYYKNWADGECPACQLIRWNEEDNKDCWLCNGTNNISKELHRQFYIDRMLPAIIRRHKNNLKYNIEQTKFNNILNRLSNEEIQILKDYLYSIRYD